MSSTSTFALVDELERQRRASTLLLQAELAELTTLPLLIEQQLAHYGRLDALANDASAFYATPVGSATPVQWNELFASNVQAPFLLSQAALLALRAAASSTWWTFTPSARSPITRCTAWPRLRWRR